MYTQEAERVATHSASGESMGDRLKVEGEARSGANWFLWIAGLSMVNSVIMLAGSDVHFIIGLGITLVFDVIGRNAGAAGVVVAALLDIMAAATFVMFGVLGRKGRAWAFILGMVVYALDAMLFIAFGDWLSVGFHAFALFGIYRGFAASRRLKEMEERRPLAARIMPQLG
jgi:hypothetical protein